MRASLFFVLALSACFRTQGTIPGPMLDSASGTGDTGPFDTGTATTDTGTADTGTADTGTTDTSTADTGTTDTGLVQATFTVRDLRFLTDVSGASVVVGDASGTTSSSGKVTLAIPAYSSFDGVFTQSDYMGMDAYGYTGGQDFSMGVWTVKRAELNSIANDIGLHLDNGDGLVVVPVLGPSDSGGLDWLAGATVDLDVTYGQVVVPYSNSGTGFDIGGNTTHSGVPTFALFLNVPPGTVNVSVTGPEGTHCTIEPGAHAAQSIEASAGAVSVQAFVCR